METQLIQWINDEEQDKLQIDADILVKDGESYISIKKMFEMFKLLDGVDEKIKKVESLLEREEDINQLFKVLSTPYNNKIYNWTRYSLSFDYIYFKRLDGKYVDYETVPQFWYQYPVNISREYTFNGTINIGSSSPIYKIRAILECNDDYDYEDYNNPDNPSKGFYLTQIVLTTNSSDIFINPIPDQNPYGEVMINKGDYTQIKGIKFNFSYKGYSIPPTTASDKYLYCGYTVILYGIDESSKYISYFGQN